MFTSIRRSRPTRGAALLAAAIVLAAAGSASARSGSSGTGHSSHTDSGHRSGSPSLARVMSPPIIATKPGDKHHHHHARFRFFDNWYWARACVVRYPARSVEEMRRIDPRWYARCRPIDEPAYY
jgi:hypothetical protein